MSTSSVHPGRIGSTRPTLTYARSNWVEMDLGLKNKVALVVASSRGLGRAVAEELATEGANLILCARDAVQLEETADRIRDASGSRVLSIGADVSLPGDVRRIVDSALSEFGNVDILVT